MDVTLRPINFDDLVDFEHIVKWYHDPEIRHLFTVDFQKGPTFPETPEEVRKHKLNSDSNRTFMILVDGELAGDASIDTNFGMLQGSAENTGWLGICIGEKKFRGKGVGYEVMSQLEAVARVLKLKRLELGVFAYNTTAIGFYKRLGYEHFHTVKEFTWYNGQWHDDLRMEKYL